MTEHALLTAEQFLPVAVAMTRRERQQKDGLTLILAPLPDCPTCARSAAEVLTSEARPSDGALSLLFRPCGHRFTVAADMGYEVARLAEEIATREEREGGDLLAEYIPPAGEKVCIGQPEPPVFVIALHSDDGTLIVGIRPDGSIQQGPNYRPDEAAREFWDAVTRAAHSAAPWGGALSPITEAMVRAAAEAIEDECLRLLGRDLGTIHRDDIARAGLEAAARVRGSDG